MKKLFIIFLTMVVFNNLTDAQDLEDYCTMAVNYGTINGRAREAFLQPESVHWYFVTFDDDAYGVVFSACDSDFNAEIEVWHGCEEDSRNLIYSNDNTGDCKISIDLMNEGVYYIRIYRNKSTFNDGNYKFEVMRD